MSFVVVSSNGRNVVQIIVQQRRRRRVRPLAVAAVLHEEASHDEDQARGRSGKLMAAQTTGELVIRSRRRSS